MKYDIVEEANDHASPPHPSEGRRVAVIVDAIAQGNIDADPVRRAMKKGHADKQRDRARDVDRLHRRVPSEFHVRTARCGTRRAPAAGATSGGIRRHEGLCR